MKSLNTFCEKYCIRHKFSTPRTPQKIEVARTMLNEKPLPKYFWAGAVNTTSYVLNHVLIRQILKKIPYEPFKDRRPTLNHLKFFGCKCFILNNGKEQLCKFDSKADEDIFLGYAINSHVYRVYNKRLMIIEESMHIVFDETNPMQQDQRHKLADDENMLLEKQSAIGNQLVEKEIQSTEKVADNNLPKEWIEPKGL